MGYRQRFLTRKRDKQVFPLKSKVPRDSGSPSFVGVDKSQIEKPKLKVYSIKSKPENVPEYNLSPRYDSRKSFYGKAVVKTENGKIILRSYNTDVAEIVDGKPIVHGTYSPTTLRHIKEFLKQHGFQADTSKQILKDYQATEKQVEEKQELEREKAKSQFKSVAMVSAMGDIFHKNIKEKNEWKLRMLKAGLGKGFNVPDDWNKLSEKEKERRLNAVIRFAKNNPHNPKSTSDERKKAIKEFENMRDMAELKALSKHSLENPLTDVQYKRMMVLKKKVFGNPKPTSKIFVVEDLKSGRDFTVTAKNKEDAKNIVSNRELNVNKRNLNIRKIIKDTDKDGVPDSKDCEPYNPKKQDFGKDMPKSRYVVKKIIKIQKGHKNYKLNNPHNPKKKKLSKQELEEQLSFWTGGRISKPKVTPRTEYYMDIPKDVAKKLNVEGREFPARSKKVVMANRRTFFGSELSKKIKIKKRTIK